MNKLPTKLIAVVLVLSTAVSSLASVGPKPAPALPLPAFETPLTAPTVLASKQPLNSAELAKYQQLADESQDLATRQAAGASNTTKGVLIALGVIVVVAVIVGVSSGASIGSIGGTTG